MAGPQILHLSQLNKRHARAPNSRTSAETMNTRKLYERYNVDLKSARRGGRSSSSSSSSSSSRRGGSGSLGGGGGHGRSSFYERYARRHVDADDSSVDTSTGASVHQSRERNNNLLRIAVLVLFGTTVWMGMQSEQSSAAASGADEGSDTKGDTSIAKVIGNSFIPKRKKKKRPSQPSRIEDVTNDESSPPSNVRNGRWNPCLDTKYELERHDHEPRHGDICRAKGGLMGTYECPEGCTETAGAAPYCANAAGTKGKTTLGSKGGPCRVRDPSAPPEYRCDYGSVCIMAVGSPPEQFKGVGTYYDDTCDNKCGDGRKGELTPWIVEGGRCTSDMDCSLSGVCTPEGKCKCDPWAEGLDCSYLRFAPVDKSRLGYLDEHHSSWGGSIVQRKSDGLFQMYVSEIICKEDPDRRKRCGLNNWETHSRIAVVTSENIEGPYRRLESNPVLLHPEHHNPSVHVSPKTGDWHLFTISGPTGPIERMISNDEGKTWGTPKTISPRQNPGPLLKEDGSTYLFYRADGLDIPFPTCSNEGISMTHCPSDDEPCNAPNDLLIFGHTGEDPSVFVDHRGYYHMLFNALPYKCVPKFQQGGHAWSLDGINWSTPRIGAFDTTIHFTDGTSMECERRERPQMVTNADGTPLALITAVTGCPKGLGDKDLTRVGGGGGNGRFYRGADDSFTIVQRMGA